MKRVQRNIRKENKGKEIDTAWKNNEMNLKGEMQKEGWQAKNEKKRKLGKRKYLPLIGKKI